MVYKDTKDNLVLFVAKSMLSHCQTIGQLAKCHDCVILAVDK